MKKIISLLLVLVLVAVALPGCHGTTARGEFVMPESFDTSREYTITFWAKNENNSQQQQIYRDIVAAFEALYPNIKVELKLYSDYKNIYQDVVTNISTNTIPDVCITYPDHIATYLTSNNLVVALDELMADEKYGLGGSELPEGFGGVTREDIVSEFLAEGVIDGTQYALPFMRSTEACYVNKTLLESLGYELPETLTWDFVWEVCEYAMSLGKNDDGTYVANGQTVLIPFMYKSADNMMITMLKQQDAGYSTEWGEIEIFNDTTAQILYTVAEHAQTGAFSIFDIDSYPANYLNAGQCIFAIDSTAGATWMGSDSPSADSEAVRDQRAEFETVVMTVPQYNTEEPKMISQGPSICVFNTGDDQQVLAAWLFAQFLLTNEAQINYAQTEGYVPVTYKAQNSDEYQDYLSRSGEDNDQYYDVKIAASQLLLDNMENTFVTPVFNGSTNLRTAAGKLIEKVIRRIRSKKAVDADYIESMEKEISTAYHLNEIGNRGKQTNLGSLPTTAIVLLVGIGVAWVAIGAAALIARKKKKSVKGD